MDRSKLLAPGMIAPLVLATAAIPQMAAAYETLPRSLAQLSPEDFAERVEILNDPLEETIVLSTRDAYASGRSVKGAYAEDVHIRALADRESGKISWQIWHDFIHAGRRKELHAIHYLSGGRLHKAAPVLVEHWLDQCPPTDGLGSCKQFVRVIFELPEHAIREAAASYRQGSREPWRIRFKSAAGKDITSGIAPAEAAGLIQAVDAWRGGTGGRMMARND
mgnify:CR=1 FL=1